MYSLRVWQVYAVYIIVDLDVSKLGAALKDVESENGSLLRELCVVVYSTHYTLEREQYERKRKE